MKVEIQLSMSSENENGIRNSVFQSRRKMKNKNRSLNFVFGNRRKTENANGISNFVFKCRRKTVGTRVHALQTSTDTGRQVTSLKCLKNVQNEIPMTMM